MCSLPSVNGVPFWNTPVVHHGVGHVHRLGRCHDRCGNHRYQHHSNLTLGHVIFLAIEAVVLMMFILMSLTRSVEAAASYVCFGVFEPVPLGAGCDGGILVPFLLSIVKSLNTTSNINT